MAPSRRSSVWSLFPDCSSPPEICTNAAKSPSRHSSTSSTSSRSSRRSSRKSADLPLRDTCTGVNDESDNTIIHLPEKQQPKQSEEMDRLIPLKLEGSPVTNSTIFLPSSPGFLSKFSNIPSFMPESPPISPKTSKAPRKARPGPVSDLTILPYTQEEWKKVMEEVKNLYSKGQYKQCSVRAKQILEGIKVPHNVHPLYSIYLSFFAASSLEMTASTLHNYSSNKLPLFQESLSLYKEAQSCVENVTFNTSTKGHHYNASIASSVHSSVDSIFSSPATSARSSIASSPTDDHPLRTHKRTISTSSSFSSLSSSGGRKKKVSFSIDLSDSEPELPATIESSLLDSFPAPPTQADPTIISTKDLLTTSPSQESQPLSLYLLTQSIARYKAHLRDLSIQLEYHISSIHSQIGHLSNLRKARRSNLPTQFTDAEEKAFGGMEGVSREEMLKVELKERIRRLKEAGWKRERFDGERYRVLCERALMEASERC